MPRIVPFEQSPLLTLTRLPLSPGLVRSGLQIPEALFSSLQNPVPTDCLEGAVLLQSCGYACDAESEIRKRVATQQEDGSFSLSFAESLALMRAAWALGEWKNDADMLAIVTRWLQWAAERENDDLSTAELADLMELTLAFCRASGGHGAQRFMRTLLPKSGIWDAKLNTFHLQRPSSRAAEADRLTAVEMADGIRCALCHGEFSGSGTELRAGARGWERISRWHGASCGGTSADPWLQGCAPNAWIEPAAAAAWAEAFSKASDFGQDWALEPLDRLMENALPVASERPDQMFRVHADGTDHPAKSAVGRLLRSWASLLLRSVSRTGEGVDVIRILPGVFVCPSEQGILRLQVAQAKENIWTIRIHTESSVRCTLRIRIPAWVGNGRWKLNQDEAEDLKPGEYLSLEREWSDGDHLTIRMVPGVTVDHGYHQSSAVYCGAKLMALPLEKGPTAYVLKGEVRRGSSQIQAQLAPVNGWESLDVPVLPEAGEAVWMTLKPFDETKERLALFAGERV